MLEYLGNSWSLWPPHNFRKGLNIVSNVQKISSDIISVALTRQGECVYHPELGLAPELFVPLSDYAPQYFIHHLEEAISKWVEGISALTVTNHKYLDYENQISTEIIFTPAEEADSNILTFGYYEYRGALWRNGIEKFLDSIVLNGERFKALI